jgi:hypothetical protein
MSPPLSEHVTIANILAQLSNERIHCIIYNVLRVIHYQQTSQDSFLNNVIATEAEFKTNLQLLAHVFKTPKQYYSLLDELLIAARTHARVDIYWLKRVNNYENKSSMGDFNKYEVINCMSSYIIKSAPYIQLQMTTNFYISKYFAGFKYLVQNLGNILPKLFQAFHFERGEFKQDNPRINAILYNILNNLSICEIEDIIDEFDEYYDMMQCTSGVLNVTPYTMSPELKRAIEDDFKHPSKYYGLTIDED